MHPATRGCRTAGIAFRSNRTHIRGGRYDAAGQVHERDARRGGARQHQLRRSDALFRTEAERRSPHASQPQDQSTRHRYISFHRSTTTSRRAVVKRHWTTILVETPAGSARTKPHLLRRALIESGRPHKCEGCGTEPLWCGNTLVFHVDHVDGNPNDSRPENVRFLCPNCHSQTPTWAGRRRFTFSKNNPLS